MHLPVLVVTILFKLANLEVNGNILKWTRSFIEKREICVRISSLHSDFKRISKVVPQGSVIGPLLFNVMMKDLLKPESNIKTL